MSSPYIESAPTDIERKIADVSKSDVCVRVQGDLSDARIFGSEWLVVTLDEVLVVPENDVNGMDKASIADLRDVRIDDFVGGGVVEFDRLDGPPIRIGFSQSMRPKFAEIAESVKAMTRGEALVLPEEIDDTQCESCGRLLPEKNGVCAVCMKKCDTFQRIVKYMLAYPGLAAATGILTVLSTVLALLPPKITQHIIDLSLIHISEPTRPY